MGNELIKTVLIMTQLLISVITDVYSYKVKNLMIIIFLLAGVMFHVSSLDNYDLYRYILGLVAPFIVLLPLYILKMLGAGDIKLFCSIGFLLGINDILYSMMYSYLFGFAMAMLIMLTRGNFAARFKRFFAYLKCCILTMSILPYDDFGIQSDGRMHFTIPIAMGTITVILFKN
jgi:prepilin peptidase CpaA